MAVWWTAVSIGDLKRRVPRGVRNWLRSPKASARYAVANARGALGRVSSVSLPVGTIRCHPACCHAFGGFAGNTEYAQELGAFLDRSKPEMRLLDIGAHYGLMSITACLREPSCRAIAVEPSRRAVSLLRRNLRLNRVDRRVTVLPIATGDRDGSLAMLSTGPAGTDHFVVSIEDRSDATDVRVSRIDTVCAANRFVPTHVKIDVEGFEQQVLTGGGETFGRADGPILFLELHGSWIAQRGGSAPQVLRILREYGYRKFTDHQSNELGEAAIAACGYWARIVCER
jgi:FkbM family methyltransferase